jgi:ribosomal protein S18 acetylase RimI-like enzyme
MMKASKVLRSYQKSVPKRLENEARLEAIAVLEGERNKGIGAKLIEEAEAQLTKKKMNDFGLSVKKENPAVRFYKRYGFEEIKEFKNILGEWYYMRKKL